MDLIEALSAEVEKAKRNPRSQQARLLAQGAFRPEDQAYDGTAVRVMQQTDAANQRLVDALRSQHGPRPTAEDLSSLMNRYDVPREHGLVPPIAYMNNPKFIAELGQMGQRPSPAVAQSPAFKANDSMMMGPTNEFSMEESMEAMRPMMANKPPVKRRAGWR